MACNLKELQEKMYPASRAQIQKRVREELQRMALEHSQTEASEIPDSAQDEDQFTANLPK
jgi:hypothetical protein